MDIAIGLPATIPGVDRERLLDWARRAEQRGFSSLSVIDRIVYANLEPLVALTAAAAVTERIRLTSTILIAPYRGNTALLAKQAASLDVVSGGRFRLGIAVGGREDDYEVSGVDMSTRGEAMDALLPELKSIWSGEKIGPKPVQEGGPPLIIGGTAEAAFRRAAQYGAGWIAGGLPPDQVAAAAESVRQAWEAAGRGGKPYIGALAYFSLGPDAEAAAQRYLKDGYYSWLGEELASMIAASAATDADTVKQYVQGFEAVVDELFWFPCQTDVAQVDLLADAAL